MSDGISVDNRVFLSFDDAMAAGSARPLPWKSAIWNVSREQAKHWLATRGPNRKGTDSAVLRFAADMIGDYWSLTPEGLVFDRDGKLIDGQTRLTAFVQTGLPSMAFVVYFGVDTDLIHTLNLHKPRTYKDRTQIDQRLSGQPVSPDFVLAIANSIIRYGITKDSVPKGHEVPKGYNIPIGMLDELIGSFLPAAEFAASLFPKNRASKTSKKLCVTPVPVALALAYLNGVTKTVLRDFAKAYLEGEKGVCLDLRDYMLQTPAAGYNGIIYALGTTQKALKAFIDKDNSTKLYKNKRLIYSLPPFSEGQLLAISGAVEAMKKAKAANGGSSS
jgi:hypothetical protein